MASLVGTKCEGCGQGVLARFSYARDVSHNGKHASIEQIGLACSYCGIESFGREEIAANKKALVSFQMDADGISPAAIRKMRRHAGLTSEAAGELFGGGEKAFSKYENAQLLPDAAMRSLLLLAINYPVTVHLLKAAKSGSINLPATGKEYFVPSRQFLEFRVNPVQSALAIIGVGSLGAALSEPFRLTKSSALIAHVDSFNFGHALMKLPRFVYPGLSSDDQSAVGSNINWMLDISSENDEREAF